MNPWQAADRAAEREMARLAFESRGQLWRLRTVATVAPWLGLLLTCLEANTAFPGFGADRATIMAVITDGLGNVLLPIPIGLGTGLLAVWAACWLEHVAAELALGARRGWAELRALTR